MKGQTNQSIRSAKLQKNLRSNMTDAEQALWRALRGRQLAGYKFRRQHPFENYILDFVSLDAKLVIEADGGQHNLNQQDLTRDAVLTKAGFKVLRFWNHQILSETEAVLEAIYQAIVDQSTTPIPTPALPLKGRGRKLLPLQGGGWEGNGSIIQASKITGIVLAGGQGRRMGLTDKGLVLLHGKPMVAHVLERFSPQVDEVLVNANQNLDQYAKLGYSVIADSLSGYAGPLAGLQAGLSAAQHELVATVPCDSPFLPPDLVARLKAALNEYQAQLAVAVTHQQPHPVFCLCQRNVLPHLTAFLDNGGRKIDAWYATLNTVEVSFDDEADAFMNINTPQELNAAK